MWRRLGSLFLFVLSLLLSGGSSAWSAPQSDSFMTGPGLAPVIFQTRAGQPDPNSLFRLANQARQSAKQPPLRANRLLMQVAEARAADMAARQYFAHKSPDGRYYYDLLPTYGADPDYSCENLDMVSSNDPQAVINDWITSPKGHRQCLFDGTVIEAGYAVRQLDTVRTIDNQETPVYVVVAIQSTAL